MTNDLTMSALYKKLKGIGIQPKYIKQKVLPSWWNQKLNDKPAAVLEGAGYIAQRLNLDLKSLLAEDQEPQFKPLPHTKFKYHQQDQVDTPNIAYQIATWVAKVIAQATHLEFQVIPTDYYQVRLEILNNDSQVNLSSLLSYCWYKGIAVVYFNDYPKGNRKITGMIQWQGDQPVIVLSSGHKNPACLAFHLAHELGHLALGHLKQGQGLLIDDEIKEDGNDQEETEANEFATHLLVNELDNCLGNKQISSGNHLQKEINKIVQSNVTIDPCAIAFNYAWHTGNYPFAQNAVKKIDCSKNGDKIINHFLEHQIDWDDLSDNLVDNLYQILGE